MVPDTANVLGVSRIFGVSTDYLLLDACDEEGDTPAAKTAERSLRERQMAVGAGMMCRVLLLSVIALYHQYRLAPEPPVPMWWLLVMLLAVAVWKWRLDWRYLVRENGSLWALLIPGLGGCSLCLFPAVFPGVGPGTMGNFPGAVGRRGIFGEKRKDFTSPLWPALEWSEEAVIPPQARFE